MLIQPKFFKPASTVLTTELIPITILSVDGALRTSTDFTSVVAVQNTNVTVTGAVAIPDQSFAMALKRDNGELYIFNVPVTNGIFTAVLNFEYLGQYTYDNDMANRDLPVETFSTPTIRVDVVRDAA